MRAAVGVSFRWVSLLPPSFLQPRVSPIGCDGIRNSANMQPKKWTGVLLGKPLGASLRWSSAAHKCRRKKKKNPTTKVTATEK